MTLDMQKGRAQEGGGGGGGGGNNSRNRVNKFLLLVYLNVHHAFVTEGMLQFLDFNPTASCGSPVRTSSGGDSPGNTPVMFLRAKKRTTGLNPRGSFTHS